MRARGAMEETAGAISTLDVRVMWSGRDPTLLKGGQGVSNNRGKKKISANKSQRERRGGGIP